MGYVCVFFLLKLVVYILCTRIFQKILHPTQKEETLLLWQHMTTYKTRKTNLNFGLNFYANEAYTKAGDVYVKSKNGQNRISSINICKRKVWQPRKSMRTWYKYLLRTLFLCNCEEVGCGTQVRHGQHKRWLSVWSSKNLMNKLMLFTVWFWILKQIAESIEISFGPHCFNWDLVDERTIYQMGIKNADTRVQAEKS